MKHHRHWENMTKKKSPVLQSMCPATGGRTWESVISCHIKILLIMMLKGHLKSMVHYTDVKWDAIHTISVWHCWDQTSYESDVAENGFLGLFTHEQNWIHITSIIHIFFSYLEQFILLSGYKKQEVIARKSY